MNITVELTKAQIKLLLSATQKLSASLNKQKEYEKTHNLNPVYSEDILNIYLWEIHDINTILLSALPENEIL